jgi:predicted PurR-regulated permease PerM
LPEADGRAANRVACHNRGAAHRFYRGDVRRRRAFGDTDGRFRMQRHRAPTMNPHTLPPAAQTAASRLSGKQLVSIVFTCLILLGAFAVLKPFLLAIIWAAIIAIASWPLYLRIEMRCGGRRSVASTLTTALVCLLLVGPMVLLIVFVMQDVVSVASYLVKVDANGAPAPDWLASVPWFGGFLVERWNLYLAQPNQLSMVLRSTVSTKGDVLQSAAQFFLVGLTGRVVTLFFALWVLYFFYRDGPRLIERIGTIGNRWLGRRWSEYVIHVPNALRAAVNGLVIVGFAEAVILSSLLSICGVPSAVLLGTTLAILAFVPGAAPLVLAVIAIGLGVGGHTISAVVVFAVGMLIVMVVDYTIRPLLIKGGTSLPFLAILFGIFGGVIAMGVVGLVIGPVILVLLMVFIREATSSEAETLPTIPGETLAREADPLRSSG